MKTNEFPYGYWAKVLGLLIILLGVFSFFRQYSRHNVFDYNELAIGLSFGFLFIFFSKEKVDDEMIHHLKFKALTRAVIIAITITHLYNYVFLNWRYERKNDLIMSISAYQFLAVTLVIATCIFYYMKGQTEIKEKND
jgi:cell division protein FtsW (lipid II flippase)